METAEAPVHLVGWVGEVRWCPSCRDVDPFVVVAFSVGTGEPKGDAGGAVEALCRLHFFEFVGVGRGWDELEAHAEE